MTHAAPGKAHREGISLMQLADLFPTEDAAREWFESRIWPSGRWVLPPLSVGEMMLRCYGAFNYSQNSARDLRCALNGA